MNVPVKDEGRAGDPCALCKAVNGVLDGLVNDLGPLRSDGDVEHLMTTVGRWFIRQALAHVDGNVTKVLQILQATLNEPQNDRMVHDYLVKTGHEAAIPTPRGPVH